MFSVVMLACYILTYNARNKVNCEMNCGQKISIQKPYCIFKFSHLLHYAVACQAGFLGILSVGGGGTPDFNQNVATFFLFLSNFVNSLSQFM